MGKRKVIGIGFHKTGTTTLGTCLKTLGYNHTTVSPEAFKLYLDGDIPALLRILDGKDSCEDWPWPLIYKEIYAAYPDARFVLTIRSSPEVWFNSLARHVDRGAGNHFKYRKYIYDGHENPSEAKELYVARYMQHNEAVYDFFQDNGADFLEVCWETGDGWAELCDFLGEPVPDVPFPVSNKDPGKLRAQLGRRHRQIKQLIRRLKA